MGGYEGMNHEAAEQLGFAPVPAEFTILTDMHYTGEQLLRVRKHEYAEAELMRLFGLTYFAAHEEALGLERRTWTVIEERLSRRLKG